SRSSARTRSLHGLSDRLSASQLTRSDLGPGTQPDRRIGAARHQYGGRMGAVVMLHIAGPVGHGARDHYRMRTSAPCATMPMTVQCVSDRRLHEVSIGIRGRYPSWPRRRVRWAVSAVLPASSMALSYAAREF